jgi:hypothetical protein
LPAVRRPRSVRLCRRLWSGGAAAGGGGGGVEAFGDLLGGAAAAGQLRGVGIQVVGDLAGVVTGVESTLGAGEVLADVEENPGVRSCAEMRLR